MPRRYERAPVAEGVCEFRFLAGPPWDWTLPGRYWERVRDQFPNRRDKPIVDAPADSPVPMELREGVNRLHLIADGGTPLLQLGPDLLAVNVLPPYPGWALFSELVGRHLATYREIAQPAGLRRIGLRYINRVRISGAEIDLGEYLRVDLTSPPLGAPIASFASQVDLRNSEVPLTLRYSFRSEASVEGTASFVVDLDAFADGDEVPVWDHVGEWLDAAHAFLERAFDLTFTELAHGELFGEIPA